MNSALAPESYTVRAPLPNASDTTWHRRLLNMLAVETRETRSAYISGLEGMDVQVVQPFSVRMDPDENRYIATSPISLVYEMGETWQAALRAYIFALVEHFTWLSEIEQSLSQSVQEELALLREHLQLKK
jgi:hypothetical protein